ncbi:hypothetical protein [Helicobacter macacae]|uniref:hypothetical protein n=1 Tax=Helicobacter macacae TaxID=398626 RepID=UPI000551BCCE|nr:hypothetical protein [Helicobacter macacae]
MTGKNPPPLSPSAEGGGILRLPLAREGEKRATTPQRDRGLFEVAITCKEGGILGLPTKNGVAHQKSPSPCGRDLGRGAFTMTKS